MQLLKVLAEISISQLSNVQELLGAKTEHITRNMNIFEHFAYPCSLHSVFGDMALHALLLTTEQMVLEPQAVVMLFNKTRTWC